jgi:RNA polymerase sigma-70 factor (ECF subfamily)
MSRDKEDLQVIDRILAGEQNAFALLVDEYKRYAFTLALRILQNKPEAEEAAQDAFVKAYHHLASFNRQAKFSTWLYRIVFNTAVSYKRKQKNFFHNIENQVIEYEQGAEGMVERKDKERFIQQGLNKLTEADKLALTLFYLKEFSLEEIGEITGMQPNTVKVRIHRARLKLADELKNILHREALTL